MDVYQKLYGPNGIETAGVLEDYALCLLRKKLRKGLVSPLHEDEDDLLMQAANAGSKRDASERGAADVHAARADAKAADDALVALEERHGDAKR